jgi:hypothetical protein
MQLYKGFHMVKLAILYFSYNRTWDSLTTATCCKSLVVVYGGNCILQIGVAAGYPEDGNALNVDTQKFIQGSLYRSAMESKKRECLLFTRKYFSFCFQKFHRGLLAESYLANLALYPGRSELPFLPANTQVLIHFILEIMLHRSIYNDTLSFMNWSV